MTDPRDRSAPQAVTLAAVSPREMEAAEALTHPSLGTPIAAPVAPAMRIDLYVGKTLEGRYLVESLLGEGGMGFVYLGRHKLIDKRVAIKILRSDFAADSEMTERFLNEAKAASSIGNPHIVDISDFGRLPDGSAFFVMEYLDGVSLARLMDQLHVVPIPRLVHIAKQIGRGLAAAHSRGIVHRDLKPDNVMLVSRGEDRDFVKVLDFGIAKVAGEANRLTRAGSVFGTPHYMSPEQAAGVPVDQRTDIYALGVILYEMAAGKVPFDADNFMGILTQHMYKAPAPIRALVPQAQDVPPGLEAIVLKCLSKKVELRYQTMDELVSDLEKVAIGAVPGAVSEMMGRSGGFNVPADYFRNPQNRPSGNAMLPAMVPATPVLPPKRRGVLMGALAGAVLMLGVVGAVLIASAVRTNAHATPSPSDSISAAPELPPPTTKAAGESVPLPSKIPLLVTVEPADAVVAIDGDKNDTPVLQPRTVALGVDERVTIRVEKQGYKTRTMTIEGSKIDPKNPRYVVKLEHESGKPLKPPVPTKPTPQPPAPNPPTPTTTAKPSAPPSCPPGQIRTSWGDCFKP